MITYSIIIPIYNAEKSLTKCIESIIHQKNKDFELILIDDGSTDTSGKICDKYALSDKRIKVIHSPNKGVSSARNIGINNARGIWLTFIDADDFIEQNYFPTKYNKSADLLIQKWEYINCDMLEDFPSEGIYRKRNYRSYLKNNLHRNIFKVPWGKFFKNDIISHNSIKFNENYKLGEDTLFVLQYLHFCLSIEVIACSTYKYNRELNPNKYKINIEKSISYLKDFFYLYKKLNIRNKIYLNSVFKYIKSCTALNNDLNNIWNNNTTIININKELNRLSFFDLYNKIKHKLYNYYITHIKIHFT